MPEFSPPLGDSIPYEVATTGTAIIRARVTGNGDTYDRLVITPDGLELGPGNGPRDVFFTRLSAGVIALTATILSLLGVRTKRFPWCDVTHNDFGALGDGAHDDAPAIQAAIDYAMGFAQGLRPYIFLPPGTYAIGSTIDLKGCSLVGCGRTTQTKILWIGAGGGIMLRSGSGDVGNSYKRLSGFQLLAGTIGDVADEAGWLLDLSDAYVDLGFRLFDVQFAGGSAGGIRMNLGWVAAHLGPDLRFDNVGGYAIDAIVANGANRQPFTIEHVYYDHNRTAGQQPGSGFMRIDNSVHNAPDVGVVTLHKVRVDTSQAWVGAKAWVNCKLAAAPAGPPGIWLNFVGCEYVDVLGLAADTLIHHDTASLVSRGATIGTVTDCQFGGLANVITGNWPATHPKPPLNGDVYLYAAGIRSGLHDFYIADPAADADVLRAFFAQEANPRFAITIQASGAAELQAGTGAGAADTRLIGRGGAGFAYVPCLVKAGVPADGDFAEAPPNGTIAIDSTTNDIYYRKAGVWTLTT